MRYCAFVCLKELQNCQRSKFEIRKNRVDPFFSTFFIIFWTFSFDLWQFCSSLSHKGMHGIWFEILDYIAWTLKIFMVLLLAETIAFFKSTFGSIGLKAFACNFFLRKQLNCHLKSYYQNMISFLFQQIQVKKS